MHVNIDTVYVADRLFEALGLDEASLRAAQEDGLQVYECLGKNWVSGGEFVQYVLRHCSVAVGSSGDFPF